MSRERTAAKMQKITVTCRTCGITESFYSIISVKRFGLNHVGHDVVEGASGKPLNAQETKSTPVKEKLLEKPPEKLPERRPGVKLPRVMVELVSFPALSKPVFRVRGLREDGEDAFAQVVVYQEGAKVHDIIAKGEYFDQGFSEVLYIWDPEAVEYVEDARNLLGIDRPVAEAQPPAEESPSVVVEPDSVRMTNEAMFGSPKSGDSNEVGDQVFPSHFAAPPLENEPEGLSPHHRQLRRDLASEFEQFGEPEPERRPNPIRRLEPGADLEPNPKPVRLLEPEPEPEPAVSPVQVSEPGPLAAPEPGPELARKEAEPVRTEPDPLPELVASVIQVPASPKPEPEAKRAPTVEPERPEPEPKPAQKLETLVEPEPAAVRAEHLEATPAKPEPKEPPRAAPKEVPPVEEKDELLLVSKSWYIQEGKANRKEAVRISKVLSAFRWKIEPAYTIGVMVDDLLSVETTRNEMSGALMHRMEKAGYTFSAVTAEQGKLVAWFKKAGSPEGDDQAGA
jgi:hypothetical protein